MSGLAPARSRKSVAVTVIGLITLLMGGYGVVFGGWVIFAGADWLEHPSKDPWIRAFALGGFVPALMVILGIVFLMLGMGGVLAGLGVILRKQWGRILTFIIAVVASLSGLTCVSDFDQATTDIAIGAAQFLYGILTFVILIKYRADFSRPLSESNAATTNIQNSA